jgi:L-alanine-DL-glutamate epimerase-like enolase superfamily enzyme
VSDAIAAVGALELRVPLPQPLVFGDWVIRERAFALVAVRAGSGAVGHAFGLTRDGPVVPIVRAHVAPLYVGRPLADPSVAFAAAIARARPILGSGMGLRALSLVDIAAWDASARAAGRSLADHLGGGVESLPAMGVIGYPPHLGLDEVAGQAGRFRAMGLGHLKLPMVQGLEANRARLEAAASAADTVSTDAGWSLTDVEAAKAIAAVMPRPGWLEDPVPPDRIDLLAAVRRAVGVRVAMGDEQGGPGFPDAMLLADAVDVVRLDAACAGGVSGLRPIVERVRRAGKALSFHIYGPMHAAIAAGLGLEDAWTEWSLPGTLVDVVTESLPLPAFIDGRVPVDRASPGMGRLFDADWLREQRLDDPDGVAGW